MAKIIKFAEVTKNQPTTTPKPQALLISFMRCLSDIDEMIENHYNKMSCP